MVAKYFISAPVLRSWCYALCTVTYYLLRHRTEILLMLLVTTVSTMTSAVKCSAQRCYYKNLTGTKKKMADRQKTCIKIYLENGANTLISSYLWTVAEVKPPFRMCSPSRSYFIHKFSVRG